MREFKNPHATLLSHTLLPIETVYCLWQNSKLEEEFSMMPEDVRKLIDVGGLGKTAEEWHDEVYDIFRRVMRQQIPINENIEFVFMLHNVPISLREQMVRHRIGSRNGDAIGVDIVPDLAESSWWSQSMRILNFGEFYEKEMYFIPQSIRDDSRVLEIYDDAMEFLQAIYKMLVGENGIPMEDARNVLPLASTMKVSWKLNFQSLLHVIGKRSCWILQYSVWSYLIKSMIDEIASKVDPVFREAILPPCFSNQKFSDCKFKFENERRLDDSDKLPLCPLYTHHVLCDDDEMEHEYNAWKGRNPELYQTQLDLAPKYGEMWDRNPWSGETED